MDSANRSFVIRWGGLAVMGGGGGATAVAGARADAGVRGWGGRGSGCIR